MSPRATDPAEQPAASTPSREAAQITGPVPGRHERVLVVDGDHRVRDGIAGLIALSEGLEVVGTTSHAHETLDAVRRLEPSVLIVDPYLPDLGSGLALVSALRAFAPTLRIVSTCREGGHDDASLAAGADACVERSGDPAAFQEALVAAVLPAPVPAPAARASRGRDAAGDLSGGRVGRPVDDRTTAPDEVDA